MRGTLGFMAIVLLLASCGRERHLAEMQNRAEADCLSLMVIEADVVSDHKQRMEFHVPMLFECRRKDASPYPELSSLIDTMKTLQSEMISVRGNTCQRTKDLLSDWDRKYEALYRDSIQKNQREGLTQMNELMGTFNSHAALYDALVAKHKIQKITHAGYAEELLERMIIWEDSLEVQGGIIAGSLQELKNLGLDRQDTSYIRKYQPISQMQLLHKNTQQKLTSIQNQQSRYESARQDEFFYLGPNLVERDDYHASQKLFLELERIMKSFKEEEGKFASQL